MATLLVILVLSIFVAPVALPPDTMAGQIVEDVLISLILLSGALAVVDRRGAFLPLAIVAVVVIVVRWTSWVLPGVMHATWRAEALLFAFTLLAGVISMKVFGKGATVWDRICGAVGLYMLLGVIWAVAYEIVNLYVPHAYAGMGQDNDNNRWSWIYFSFTTLTTVGYGDITPVSRLARSLSNMEALIGQLYPAVVLARMVSLPASTTPSVRGPINSRWRG
jgi:hypothetical protein